MNPKTMEILQTGLTLVVNAPPIRDFECPYCGSSEGTMLSNVGDKIIFTCFRAKCPENGTKVIQTTGNAVVNPAKVKKKPFQSKNYEGKTSMLSGDQVQFFYDTYEIDPRGARIRWSDAAQRFAIPLFTYHGDRWGWGLRSFDRTQEKKFILYKQSDVPNLYFCPDVDYRVSDTIVLVEDVFSAIKVSKHLPAVALLGTSLSKESLNLLAQEFKNVIIWLDYDTWQPPIRASSHWLPKPRSMKRDIDLYFNHVSCICSKGDPKDTEHKIIREYLKLDNLKEVC